MEKLIDKILTEWAYRVDDGMPNPANNMHMIHLEESLNELNLPKPVVKKVLEKVRTYVDNSMNRKLKRVGKPWGSKGKTSTTDTTKSTIDTDTTKSTTDTDTTKSTSRRPDENNELNNEKHRAKIRENIAKQREKRRQERDAMIAKYPEHAETIKALHAKVDKLYEDIDKYLSEPDQNKRKQLGEDLFKNHNIAVNKVIEGDTPGTDNIKFYHNDIYNNKDLKEGLPPGLHATIQKRWGKVIPGGKTGHALAMGIQKDGVKVKDPSDMAVEEFNKIKDSGDKKAIKKALNAVRSSLVANARRTSKPEMGPQRKEIKENGEVDTTVREVMGAPPLDGITRTDGKPNNMSGLFGPLDENGNVVKTNTPEGSRKTFEYSVTQNDSLDKTIEELERQRDLGVVSQKMVDTVKGHKERMNNILNRTKLPKDHPDYLELPSEEASRLVQESYETLFNELDLYQAEDGSIISRNITGQPAGSMIANMAEQALFDSELTRGDEVYLPSAGTFPGGDKVKVNRDGDNVVERAESISVKVGDTGKFYGFPGEIKQYQKYHNDKHVNEGGSRIDGEPSYRDRHRNNTGEKGYATGVKDELLSNPKLFNKMLSESGIKDAVKDPERLQKTLDEMSKCIASKTDGKGTKPANKKDVQDCVARANKELQNILDPKKLEEIVGPNNAKLILGGKPDSALIFTNMISFGAIINTSNGLEGLSHNHMDMNTKKQHTEKGTTNLRDYNFNFRHGEASRNGGFLVGFYRETPDVIEPKVS